MSVRQTTGNLATTEIPALLLCRSGKTETLSQTHINNIINNNSHKHIDRENNNGYNFTNRSNNNNSYNNNSNNTRSAYSGRGGRQASGPK